MGCAARFGEEGMAEDMDGECGAKFGGVAVEVGEEDGEFEFVGYHDRF